MVLLIGNYASDPQQSMRRFATMMVRGLTAAGIPVELIEPSVVFGECRFVGTFVRKWLAYIDKLIVFPLGLRNALSRHPAIVHVCDHSNAVYVREIHTVPVVVTCHDLLAVRGALGEETDCPASITGRILQRWILNGLRRAAAVVCVSGATLRDAERLVGRHGGSPQLGVIPVGLNYPYRKLPAEVVEVRLATITTLKSDLPFFLHVGSNLRRKNREGVVRIFARIAEASDAQLVFVGDALNPKLRKLAARLGVERRVIEIVSPPSETLEALYNRAVALLYPSRFEGFGWPIIEAQACGCPVLCSDCAPLPEIAGDAALFFGVDDEDGFARAAKQLTRNGEREKWGERCLQNARRYNPEKMIASYIEVYRSLAPQV